MVQVDTRPLDQPLPRELGNGFALVLFSLPSGLDTTFARLAETTRRMDAIKDSPDELLTFGIIRVIGRTAPNVERFPVVSYASKARGVTTNVLDRPGLAMWQASGSPRCSAGFGSPGTRPWAPASSPRRVQIGFNVDVEPIRDPEELLAAFTMELDHLRRLGRAP